MRQRLFNPLIVMNLLIATSHPASAQKANPIISKTLVTTVQIDTVQGKTAQFQEMGESIFLRTGGFIYKKKGPFQSKDAFKPLKALSEMNGLVDSMLVVGDTLWVTKLSNDRDAKGVLLPENKKPLMESQLIYSRDGGQTFKTAKMDSFKMSQEFEFETPEGLIKDVVSIFAPLNLMKEGTIGGKEGLVTNVGGGRSAWVTFDKGNTWKSLIAGKETWSADSYPGSFHIIGRRVLFGGEEPLDEAYLEYGDIGPSGTIQNLVKAKTENMGNRRVQFIENSPFDSALVFAGVEGGLMRSTNGGLEWKFSYSENEHSNRGARSYPYITQVLFPCPANQNVVLAGGQPQLGQGTLLYSEDSGKSWKDISEQVIGTAEFLGISQLKDGTLTLVTRVPADENLLVFSNDANVFSLKMNCGK